MMYKCHLAENEIWERIQAGEDLTPELSAHIAVCPKCTGVEKEVRRLVEVMQVETVPNSPDCRADIMARISNRRSSVRELLAYSMVFAVVLVIAGLVGSRLTQKPMPPRVVHQIPAKSEIHKIEPKAPVQVQDAPKPVVPKRPQIVHSNRMVKVPINHRHVQAKSMAKAPVGTPTREYPVITNDVKPVIAEVVQENTPVLAVVVSWSGKSDTSESSYSYTTTDSQTGIETTCIAERSDNNVYIHLESKPSTEKSPT